MTAPSYTPVRAPRGRRVHIIAVDDENDGAVACGRRARSGWVVAVDRLPDCAECLAAIGRKAAR